MDEKLYKFRAWKANLVIVIRLRYSKEEVLFSGLFLTDEAIPCLTPFDQRYHSVPEKLTQSVRTLIYDTINSNTEIAGSEHLPLFFLMEYILIRNQFVGTAIANNSRHTLFDC